MTKFFLNLTFIACLFISFLFVATPVLADISIKDVPDYVEDLTIGGGTELYFMAYEKNALGFDKNDYNWVDGVFRLNTTLKLKSNVEFKLGMLYTGTFGQDYYDAEADTSKFNADDAYIKFSTLFNTPVDLTLGRQRINVEKGFLMSEGNLDFSTAIYTNSEKASPFAARIDVNLEPLTLLAYWENIATDNLYQGFGKGDDIEAMGLNAHYNLTENKYVYAGAVRWLSTIHDLQADPVSVLGKQVLVTYYLGTDLAFGPIHFEGEYAKQTGDSYDAVGASTSQDAHAYFAFLKYSMDNVALKPWVEVGTYAFSGDDPATTDNEGFNTMTLGFPDWGKFSPGEVFGEQLYFGANNYKDYMLQVGILPTETMQVRLQYHKVKADEKAAYGGTSDDLYSEYDLFVEFFPNENLYFGIVVGVADPDKGHEELVGAGATKTAIGVMPFLVYNF